ncbi:MAG TPA: alpha/beta fold hydrolase [Thermoleophilia bacterium]|nr:alpha/beta fold hydrolase [Thermoleophilia bacterium]
MPRVTFRNPRDQQLVADYTPAEGAPLVVLAHGFGSERRARGRFPAMAAAFATAGYATLAFDFAGCGESDDDILTLDHQVEDLRAAIACARSLGHERLGLHGHSLGGRVCLQASPPEVATIATAGAPTGPVAYDWHDYYTAEQMDELARTGHVTMPQGEERSRATVVAGSELLEELRGCDQAALFGRVPYPVLLIDGDGDWEERQYLALARQGLPLLPAGSRVELVPGAPHNLVGYLDQVIALLLAWFGEHLPVRV